MKRCPKGTRRNKRTGNCEPSKNNVSTISPIYTSINTTKKTTINKKCPNGTRRNKKTGNCEKNKQSPKKQSPKQQSPKKQSPKKQSPKKQSPKTIKKTLTISYSLPIKFYGKSEATKKTKDYTLKEVKKNKYPLESLKDAILYDRNYFIPYTTISLNVKDLNKKFVSEKYKYIDVLSNDIDFVTNGNVDYINVTITMGFSTSLNDVTMENIEQLIYDSFKLTYENIHSIGIKVVDDYTIDKRNTRRVNQKYYTDMLYIEAIDTPQNIKYEIN